MSRSPFWLSHHAPDDHHRCVRLAGVAVCTRCLGTYPLMLAVIAWQIAVRAPLAWRFDVLAALALPLPALLDWARGRFDPRTGNNPLRFATGALLGVSLGRTLYLHLRQPLPVLLIAQMGSLAVAAAVVEIVVRRSGRDRAGRGGGHDTRPGT